MKALQRGSVWRRLTRLAMGSVVALAVALAVPSSAHAGWPDVNAATDHERNNATVDHNRFITIRRTVVSPERIQGYDTWLGDGLLEDMRGWHEGMTVVDGGAGTAGLFADLVENARMGYAASFQPKSLPRMVAVSAARPRAESTHDWQGAAADRGTQLLGAAVHRLDVAIRESGGKLTYLEGRLGEDKYPVENAIGLGTVDRVVEVYGASHYTEHFDRVLRGYGAMLRRGGQIRLHVDLAHLYVRGEHGEAMTVRQYLEHIPGLRLVSMAGTHANAPQYQAVVLERTDAPLEVPALETDQFRIEPGWTAPTRAYRVSSRPAAPVAARAVSVSVSARVRGGGARVRTGGVRAARTALPATPHVGSPRR